MALSIPAILNESEARLSGVDSPRLSAELLAAHVLGCTRLQLIIDRHRTLDDVEIEFIRTLVERRRAGEPLAYILGTKEFFGLDFKVTSDTLTPRPETEHIVEAVEAVHGKNDVFRFVDLGTGSGILAVTIALLFPRSNGVAVDLSSGALAVARENSVSHGVEDRLIFLLGDFMTRLFADHTFDLIVSNPPYVTAHEYEKASHEVTGFEPQSALVSGEDGLDHIKAMLPIVSSMLKSDGRFYVEMGWRQAKSVMRFIEEFCPEFGDVHVIRDLAGHDRILGMRKL